jgi:CheY-like chemotaxis protein
MTGSILIVDDNAAVREALTDLFDSIAATVYTAANGQEGLEILLWWYADKRKYEAWK